ncbi:MAG: hypothetical protein JSW58_15035 [Candidatus Latescibacterota bacterium]|nr:MAG: hypothetical protein JSW58_15035 [Candidatus Latescibacterota bacterium]
MTVEVTLDVFLKGVDLVASTAFLTLRDKMGYRRNLLALSRLDAYGFAIETEDPDRTVATLKRVLATQSTFYNRNKHNYFLDCRWEGGGTTEGTTPEDYRQQLVSQARKTVLAGTKKDFDSTQDVDRVIFKDVPVYRTEVLVEDLDPAAKTAMARKLEDELSAARVVVTRLGTCWHLALRAETDGEAREVTEGIVVTKKRDRGLLLNPNYQGHKFLALEQIGLGR